MITGMLCLGIVIGILLGGLSVKSQLTVKMSTKVVEMSSLMLTMVQNFTAVNESMTQVIHTQDALIQSISKEKKALQKQLNKSTEAIAELEEHLSGMSEDEDSSDDSEDHIEIKPHNTVAQDKLITLKAILEDSVKKGEQIDPKSLLGIVRLK